MAVISMLCYLVYNNLLCCSNLPVAQLTNTIVIRTIGIGILIFGLGTRGHQLANILLRMQQMRGFAKEMEHGLEVPSYVVCPYTNE